jgi:hypothetical protein
MTVELHPELVTDALSIVPIAQRATATEFLATVRAASADAKAIEVTDDLTFAQAGEALRQIKTVAKSLEATRTAMKSPVLEAGRQIDAFFKAPAGQLADAEGSLKKRISAYTAEQERKRREAEEAARRERERLAREQAERDRAERDRIAAAEEAARIATEASPMDEAPAVAKPEPIPAAPAPEPVALPEIAKVKGISTRQVAKARVVSIVDVVRAAAAGNPEAFAILAIDSAALNGLVRKHGTTLSIPGVEVFEETIVAAKSA